MTLVLKCFCKYNHYCYVPKQMSFSPFIRLFDIDRPYLSKVQLYLAAMKLMYLSARAMKRKDGD